MVYFNTDSSLCCINYIFVVLWCCIIFNWVVGDVLSSDLSLTERVIIMSTYEELQIILTTALLIVAILSYANKR
ncbi:hypothetical protein DXA98_14160 [Lachnospiraceae bacterium OF09-6]|nr:hypothetical protein DXA98_14160 [Lachnospiraceae bacterium OF09-6]